MVIVIQVVKPIFLSFLKSLVVECKTSVTCTENYKITQPKQIFSLRSQHVTNKRLQTLAKEKKALKNSFIVKKITQKIILISISQGFCSTIFIIFNIGPILIKRVVQDLQLTEL